MNAHMYKFGDYSNRLSVLLHIDSACMVEIENTLLALFVWGFWGASCYLSV